MTYDNTNRWTLNKNDRKEKETHPDYKGKINVDGVDYYLDGWIKEGANGKFISGSIKLIEARTGNGTPSYQVPAGGDLEDDIPFISSDPRFG